MIKRRVVKLFKGDMFIGLRLNMRCRYSSYMIDTHVSGITDPYWDETIKKVKRTNIRSPGFAITVYHNYPSPHFKSWWVRLKRAFEP